MALIPRDSPVPPGGYHFIDRSGGTEVTITGSSSVDVANNVLKHRIQNSRPPGNPLQEVYDYVCGNWRHLCNDTNPPPIPQHQGPEHISTRIVRWMNQFVSTSGPDDGASQQEADRRAGICRDCPKNISYASGCGACTETINRLSFIYRRGRTTPEDRRLNACDALDEHLPTSVWSTRLGAPGRDVPEFCWRKTA